MVFELKSHLPCPFGPLPELCNLRISKCLLQLYYIPFFGHENWEDNVNKWKYNCIVTNDSWLRKTYIPFGNLQRSKEEGR